MEQPVGDLGPASAAAATAERFQHYARSARGTAVKNRTRGDAFGEQLATARAEVYEQAAELVRRMPARQAAQEMMDRAGRSHVRTPPLMEFEGAGLRYIAARAWQFCALEIDPGLQQKAPRWE